MKAHASRHCEGGLTEATPLRAAETFKSLAAIVVLSFFVSCKYFKPKPGISDEKPIARVQDAYLYASDVEPIVKSAQNAQDSASFVKTFVEDWVKRKLMIEKAVLYLPNEQLDIDRQVNDYRESLILFAYEKELILQKLDTVVPDAEVRQYYESYKQNFELESDVAQLQYVKAANNVPKADSLPVWFASEREADKIKLEDFCFQYAAGYSLNDSIWFETPEILKTIPITQREFAAASANKSETTVRDSLFFCVLRVNDSKYKSEIAPFAFVKADIIRLILNKRKMDLVRLTYDNIFREAQRKNEFEIYE